MAGHAADIDGHVVAHHLSHGHGEGFRLGGVDLARHDGRARFVGGNDQFSDTTTRAGGQHADVVADLHQGDGHRLQGAVGLHDGVVGGQGFKFIGGGHEGKAGEFGDLGGYLYVVALRSVQAGADGGAAQGQLRQVGQAVADGTQAVIQLGNISGKFLAHGHRRGVHKVGAADFDHLHEFFRLLFQGIPQGLDARNGGFHQHFVSGDVHGRGEGVVGRLRLVDVVVGVEEFFIVG